MLESKVGREKALELGTKLATPGEEHHPEQTEESAAGPNLPGIAVFE